MPRPKELKEFDELLLELAARYRQDVTDTVCELRLENQQLRRQLAGVRQQSTHNGSASLSSNSTALPTVMKTLSTETSSDGTAAVKQTTPKGLLTTERSKERLTLGIDDATPMSESKVSNTLQRLLHAFSLQSGRDIVSPDIVLQALKRRGLQAFTLHKITELLAELGQVAQALSAKLVAFNEPGQANASVTLEQMDALFNMPTLEGMIPQSAHDDILLIRKTLLKDEFVGSFQGRGGSHESFLDDTEPGGIDIAMYFRRFHKRQNTKELSIPARTKSSMNIIVGSTVLLSLLFLGLSLDFEPEHAVWTYIEATFCTVFFCEICVNLYYLGWRLYLCGDDYALNWLDVCITVLSWVDLAIAMLGKFYGAYEVRVRGVRTAMILRVLRLCRFARVFKLLHKSPMLKQLANMLTGLVLGVPTLLWILVAVILLLYIVAIFFRTMLISIVGDEVDIDTLIERCGHADFLELDIHGNPVDPTCRIDHLYAAEYFSSVLRSMITVFRMMIGDDSTAAGKNLALGLEHSNNVFFFFYIPFMIIVIFGIFNIITAIFVDTITAGLKVNETRMKQKKFYETQYVEDKLLELTCRINEVCVSGVDIHEDTELTESVFEELLDDTVVKQMLADLDVCLEDRRGIFDLFDINGNGRITFGQLLKIVVKLRGEPHKSDIIACWVGVRSLHQSLNHFQSLTFASLKELGANIQHDLACHAKDERHHEIQDAFVPQTASPALRSRLLRHPY